MHLKILKKDSGELEFIKSYIIKISTDFFNSDGWYEGQRIMLHLLSAFLEAAEYTKQKQEAILYLKAYDYLIFQLTTIFISYYSHKSGYTVGSREEAAMNFIDQLWSSRFNQLKHVNRIRVDFTRILYKYLKEDGKRFSFLVELLTSRPFPLRRESLVPGPDITIDLAYETFHGRAEFKGYYAYPFYF